MTLINQKDTLMYKYESQAQSGAAPQYESEEQKSMRRAEQAAKQKRPVIRYEEPSQTESSNEASNKPPVEEPGYLESFLPSPNYPVTNKEEQIDAAIEWAARAEKRQRMRWISGMVGIGFVILFLIIFIPVTCSTSRKY